MHRMQRRQKTPSQIKITGRNGSMLKTFAIYLIQTLNRTSYGRMYLQLLFIFAFFIIWKNFWPDSFYFLLHLLGACYSFKQG